MGSLPNLNELCRERAERRLHDRERDVAREQCREREFCRGAVGGRDRAPATVEMVRTIVERLPARMPQQVNIIIIAFSLEYCAGQPRSLNFRQSPENPIINNIIDIR